MKPTAVIDIMKSLQRLFIDHLATDWPIVENIPYGSTIIKVLNTSQYREGDDIFIKSESKQLVEPTQIVEIMEWDIINGYRIRIDPPVQTAWLVSDGTSILKAINHQPLKRVFLGDLKIIPDFPSIAISLPSENNEWFTLRSTSHEYSFVIRAYVLSDNFETGSIYIGKFGEYIREILIDHIHPIVDDPPIIVPITSDVVAGATVISLSSTEKIMPGDRVYLKDGQKRPSGSQEAVVKSILSPSEIRLCTATEWDFLVQRQAQLMVALRYLYDTRPSSIRYGYVPGQGGSLMHCAEISYYAKEAICRTGNLIT